MLVLMVFTLPMQMDVGARLPAAKDILSELVHGVGGHPNVFAGRVPR